ncbi:MAG: AAA family ATPase, partial [Pseudomonadota bacterium]
MDNSSLVGLFKNISKVIIGKQEAILLTIATLLCRGHLLIEDAPGLGKTMLARALASSLDMDFK